MGEEAFEKTKQNILPNKIMKHRNTAASTYNYIRGKKVLGLIDRDEVNGLVTFAKPIGVIAVITPVTNPTSTPVGNGLYALISGNAFIVCPHPASKKSSAHCVEMMSEAAVAAGAPEGLIQVVKEPTEELSSQLMAACDAICATGGPGMVKAAYSSGTPAFGVGAGNVQSIICDDLESFERAAYCIAFNRSYDRGMPCTGDQTLYIPRSCKEAVLAAMVKEGCYVIDDSEQRDKMRELLFQGTRSINRAVVGQSPAALAKMAGMDVEIPEEVSVLLIAMDDEYDQDDVLNLEVLCPIIRYRLYDDLKDAVAMAKKNLQLMGAGHSSVIYTNDVSRAEYAGEQLPVGRMMVNQPNIHAGGNSPNNGLSPTITLGCGFWGGNSITENLTFANMRNYTRVAFYNPDAEPYDFDHIFDD